MLSPVILFVLGSITASVEVDNFVDGSLHQTAIRDSHCPSMANKRSNLALILSSFESIVSADVARVVG
ncbi:MAG: hypothetical protein WCD28_07620 [Nitrososphaeraceae archaeon]